MACQYMGFEGSFVTLSGAQYDSVDTPSEVGKVICPDDVMNITECWTNETRVVVSKNETIAVVCCPVSPCSPSGQALRIPDDAYSESSCSSTNNRGSAARLDGPSVWRPSKSDQWQWIQVQLEYSIVTAIIIQGGHNAPDVHEWVTSFTISSSLDGETWNDYLDVYSGSVRTFPGNYDKSTHVTHTFIRPVVGRYFRIHPKTFNGYIAVGMVLYGYGPLTAAIALLNLDVKLGCSPLVLGEGLGVEDGRIPDSSLTSSTVIMKGDHAASEGRLNSDSAWVPSDSDTNKWVKVDLGNDTLITGIVTQGRYIGNGEKVTSVSISYSRDNTQWLYALQEFCGAVNRYPANFDQDTYVTTLFPKPVTARYVRIHTLTYYHHASMRFEVLGINN
nr:lactadherin-like [Lytechinus pictus]